MYRAYGAQQPALRVMEGLQSRHPRPESHLSGPPKETVLQALEAFAAAWDSRYTQISRSWQSNRTNLATFFAYPADIRNVIHTTNAIGSLNSESRHAIRERKVFPTDESVKKVVWLAIQAASQKWTMPLRDWRMAMSRFIRCALYPRPSGRGYKARVFYLTRCLLLFNVLADDGYWCTTAATSKIAGTPQNAFVVILNCNIWSISSQ
ncbi:transposase within CP-933O; partial [Escherichia coli]|nr:transposase within CP-933O; partial [Escherichia coli]SQL83573.1 transposase within CP-933O; partial [Escherichia coli]SQS28746.1 transposase within CP-933O; partial [Escherichia coli]